MGVACAGAVGSLLPPSGWSGRWVLRLGWPLVVAVVAAVMLAVSASAQAEDCQPGPNGSPGDYGYNAACGPEYESPAWGNAAGWTDASQYSTIKLADITGNGTDELIARNSDGLEIWRFDTSLGQWRPAIDATGNPQVLSDFRSPLPNQDARSLGANPMVYSSIQTADVLGNSTQSIIAQFPDGVHTYDYTPPAGTKNIVGGTWHEEPVGGPAGGPPSEYLNLRAVGSAASVSSPNTRMPATIIDQGSYWLHQPSGGWAPGTAALGAVDALPPQSSEPKYYLNTMAGEAPRSGSPSAPAQLAPAYVWRTADGVQASAYDTDPDCSYGCPREWLGLAPVPNGSENPFPDKDSVQYGCLSENISCFGQDPSRYETMRVADNLRGPGDIEEYVLGRMGDGLHAYGLQATGGWDSVPVLTALADPGNAFPPAGEWSSIRTGDVNGDGRTDVLALVGGQLQVWELKSNGSGGWVWSRLPAAVPLNLGQTFEGNASNYSTIQVGPVAGPGYPDAVIARGPFGIRTWFYCAGGSSPVPACSSLQGQSGWTSWLPQPIAGNNDRSAVPSYPQFTGGQAAAWTALNALAHSPTNPLIADNQPTVRDVWTATNAPSSDRLSNLSNGIVQAAGCSGQTTRNPPAYSTCTPPPGIAAADWKAVVNETLADIYYAGQTVDFYTTLGDLRRDIFLAQGATLPAVGSVLEGLNSAAGNASELSPQSVWSTIFGIAGAIAGAAENPAFGITLSIGSYLLGMIPSASPDMTAPPFYGTFSDLQNRFAAAVGEADTAQSEQSYEVRQNWGLLRLVGQLTGPTGAWHTIDSVGIKSAAEEGYVLYLYKQLLPTVYDRYVINGCNGAQQPYQLDCQVTRWSGMVGSGSNFQTLDLPPDNSSYSYSDWQPCAPKQNRCAYVNPPPDNVATQVWGPISNGCNYDGHPDTAWHYRDPTNNDPGCNLGIDPALSVDSLGGTFNGWIFTTCSGNPTVVVPSLDTRENDCQASGLATAGDTGALRLTLHATLPRGFHVRGATLPGDRLLFEPKGAGGLLSRPARPKGAKGLAFEARGHGLGKIHLTVAEGGQRGGTGGKLLGSSPAGPTASLTLHTYKGSSTTSRPTTMQLTLGGVRLSVPHACQQLPAAVSMASPTFTLQTSLTLSDGHSTHNVSMPTLWKCVRNRSGSVTALRTVKPRAPARRRGLGVSVAGPHTVIPGSVIKYTVRVRNTRRRPRNRVVSSLWNIAVQQSLSTPRNPRLTVPARRVVRHVPELRRRRTKVLRIPVHIPSRLAHSTRHVCVVVHATAPSTRSTEARACARIGRLPPGLG